MQKPKIKNLEIIRIRMTQKDGIEKEDENWETTATN
jgi:hypothetical protein